MTTQYPSSIDGYAQIRIVADRLDEILAKDHNDLRSAVIAIEQTLGLNPQGIFGTVVERLEDAYGSLQAHVAGLPPRHLDTVLESPTKIGSPHFSLLSGTVGSQLQDLLDYVNAPRYSGSWPQKFANGEFMGPSTIETALDGLVEVIEQVHRYGGWDGYAALADGYVFPASTIGQGMDQIIAQIAGPEGSLKIGANAFVKGDGRIPYDRLTVGHQMRESGEYIAEHTMLLEKALSGFVVSGLGVTRLTAATVAIGPGDICVEGRFGSYGGGTFTLGASGNPPAIGSHHIYAVILPDGQVVIGDTANPDVFMGVAGNDPTVPLQTFNETGAGWTEDTDVRRYGLYSNNQPYLTVGNDAYGADFTSLKSALAYMGLLQSTTAGINKPRKIVLVGDVFVDPGDVPLPIWSDVEIDGGFHRVEWTADAPLFLSEDASAVSLKNIRAVFSGADGYANTAFYQAFAATGGIADIDIHNCVLNSNPGGRTYNFVKFDDGGSHSIARVKITNCLAEILLTGVWTPPGSNTMIVSRVSDCAFYQSGGLIATSDQCIKVGQGSIVSDNLIFGGFGVGIQATSGETTIIHGNRLNGGSGDSGGFGTAYMNIGIQLDAPSPGLSTRSVVADNIVKGTVTCGIMARSGSNSSAHVVISGNVVDNLHDPSVSMTGILCRGDENLVIGNYILGAAVYGIENASQAIGNVIWDSHGTPTAAIQVNPSASHALVASNFIHHFLAPMGILGGTGQWGKIVNNVLVSDLGTTTEAILVSGQQSVVAGNYIARYGTNTTDTTIAVTGNSGMIVNNYLENCQGNAIGLDGAGFGLIHGNYMVGAANANAAIDNFGQRMCITDNFIYNYSAAGVGTVIRAVASPSAPYAIIANNHLVGCKGVGIDIADNIYTLVNGNYLVGSSQSTWGVVGFGKQSVVSDNIIDWYGYNDGYAIHSTANANGSIISSNIITAPKGTMPACIALGGGADAVTIANNSMGLSTATVTQVGIELYHTIGCLVIGNRIVGEQLAVGKPAINNVGSGTLVASNRILRPNGAGIWAINSVWCLIVNNQVMYPPSAPSSSAPFGIVAWRGGDMAIVGNTTFADHSSGAGIYVPSSDRCLIANNVVWMYSASIWVRQLDSDPSTFCLVTGNYVQTPSYAGIYIDTGCIGTSVVGNYIINSDVGIDIWAAECAVLSNFITDYVDYAIDLNGADECCVVGNHARFPDGATTNVDGMDLSGVIQSLVVGNWMEGKGAGTGFIITNPNPSNGLVMAGNLSRAGVAPSDGAGGTWPATANIDTYNCRHIP